MLKYTWTAKKTLGYSGACSFWLLLLELYTVDIEIYRCGSKFH